MDDDRELIESIDGGGEKQSPTPERGAWSVEPSTLDGNSGLGESILLVWILEIIAIGAALTRLIDDKEALDG